MLVTAILAWFHIISAIGWLGGGIMFAVVVAPALEKLSAPSSGEFFVKVVPRVARFFQIVAGSTVLLGVLLLYGMDPNGGFRILSLSSSLGFNLTIGLSIGFVAFLMSEFVAVPPLFRAIRIIKETQASSQQQPPEELRRTLRRAAIAADLTVSLLVLTSVFMVAAGFY